MKCSRCGYESPEGTQYCGICGASTESMRTTPPSASPAMAVPIPPSRKLPWKILSVALAAFLIGSNIAWVYVKATDNHDLSAVSGRLDQLQKDYGTQGEALETQQSANSDLQKKYDDLLADLSNLGPQYELYQRLRIESLAADYYQTIRENVGPQSAGWRQNGGTWAELVSFCSELAMHDEGKMSWKDYEAMYFDGYQTYSYDDALAKLKFVNEYAGVSTSNTSVENVAAILQFIVGHVEYQRDMIDKFFAPVETLFYRSGDCEDFSALAAALFEVAGIDSAIGFFSSTSESSGHAMALVHLDNLGAYNWTYYSDLTSFGLSSGTWITIEPQSLITDQSGSWISQWVLEAAAEA